MDPSAQSQSSELKENKQSLGEKISTERGNGSWACCGRMDEDLVALEQPIGLVRRQEEGEEVHGNGD